jgi:hypothetical protein
MNTASKCIYSLMMLQLPMLQCCRLPMQHAPNMLQAANTSRCRTASCFRARLPTAMLQAAYAARSQQCCRLPMLQCCTFPTCGDAALDRIASYFQMKLPAAMLQAAYVTMLQPPSSMLQCCRLPIDAVGFQLPTCFAD